MTDHEAAQAKLHASRGMATSIRSLSGFWLPIGVVIGLIVFFSFGSSAFFTLRNMTGILGQASTLLLACLGASFVVLMGSIDLSVGAMVLLVGAVTERR